MHMQEPTEAIALAHAVLEEMTIVVNAIAEIEKVLPADESPNLRCLRAAAVRVIMLAKAKVVR